MQCNSAIGFMNDDPEKLRACATYLETSLQKELKGGTPLPLRRLKHTAEHKEKLRQQMKGNKRALGGKSKTGQAFSAVTRKKLSEAIVSRLAELTEEQKKKMREDGREAALKRWGGVPRDRAL